MTLPDKEPNPDERKLMEGSKGSSVGPWVIILLIVIGAVVAYALFAM